MDVFLEKKMPDDISAEKAAAKCQELEATPTSPSTVGEAEFSAQENPRRRQLAIEKLRSLVTTRRF